jgi:hypothetical protein
MLCLPSPSRPVATLSSSPFRVSRSCRPCLQASIALIKIIPINLTIIEALYSLQALKGSAYRRHFKISCLQFILQALLIHPQRCLLVTTRLSTPPLLILIRDTIENGASITFQIQGFGSLMAVLEVGRESTLGRRVWIDPYA